MKLRLGFSPCPNDTFIFNAMVNHLIDHDFELEIIMADIKELNELALNGELDIVKVSYHAYAYQIDQYQLLNSGSALGRGVGPLLISKEPIDLDQVKNKTIAIPGERTTANFLMQFALPKSLNKEVFLFSQIESAVLDSKVDLGVIIHENRFTYTDKGLYKVVDLGEYWEKQTSLPIPLGGIAIKRELKETVKILFDKKLKESILFAFEHKSKNMAYIQVHAQEMSTEVIKKHIELYVNDYSIKLGNEGKKAVLKLLSTVLGSSEKEISKKFIFL